MREKSKGFNIMVQPITHWAAHQALVGRNRSRPDPRCGRFTVLEVDTLMAETWREFNRM